MGGSLEACSLHAFPSARQARVNYFVAQISKSASRLQVWKPALRVRRLWNGSDQSVLDFYRFGLDFNRGGRKCLSRGRKSDGAGLQRRTKGHAVDAILG